MLVCASLEEQKTGIVDQENPVDELETVEDVFNKIFTERTFGDLKVDFEKFQAMGGIKSKHGKHCNSTVNPSILHEDDTIRVIDKVPLPELHLMEGVLNHLFWEKGGLVDILGREKAMEWAQKCNVVSAGYHGEIFEGPASRKLLKNADYLLSEEYLANVSNPFAVVPIVRCLY